MKASGTWVAAIAAAWLSLPVAAAAHEGVLELRWGDAAQGAQSRFEVTLVEDDGRRVQLDPAQALRAAGNLYRLNGQRVVVAASQAGASASGLLGVDAIGAASLGMAPATPHAVAGAQPWVTLLCKFADAPGEPQAPAYFSTMLSNATGRLDHYWREVSYGKVDIADSQVHGWFTLPHPRHYYVPDDAECFSDTRADLEALWRDCTAVADDEVDFSGFVGINTMYNDELDNCAWGGGIYETLDGVTKYWYSTWEPPWGYANEAPLAHEMGHGFGLPHANNSDDDGDPYDNPWDVMSDSWYRAASDATYGVQPKHINTWSRDALGWIDAARKLEISVDGVYAGIVLDRASLVGSANRQMIVVTLPPPQPSTHYYTIEARKRVGYYEAKLAGDAVIIHEVDTTRDEPAWSVDADVPPADRADNEGSMFKVGESWTAPDGAFKVKVVAATSEGFIVDVERGDERIFRDGFER